MAWLVMHMEPWKGINATVNGGKVSFDLSTFPGVGFCPVYESREDAGRDYPGAVLLQVELTDTQPIPTSLPPAAAARDQEAGL